MLVSPQLTRQPSRTTSTAGYESDQSSDTAAEDDFASFPPPPSAQHSTAMPAMWQSRRQESGSAVSRLSQKFAAGAPAIAHLRTPSRQEPGETSPDDDTRSRSSTLNGDEQDFEFPEKTPTSLPKPLKADIKMDKVLEEEPASPPPAPHVPGPLESQLAALMSKIIFMERANPTVSVSPDEHAALSKRVAALEVEKMAWTKRHEAIWALRDEDVENNIKIRGLLAKARRELEAMTKLRDEDLTNVQAVRLKLAEKTRELDRLQAHGGSPSAPFSSASGRASPGRGGRPGSVFLERRDTTDLFAAAKAAALEQRALELEKRNQDLQAQIESLKGGASVDDLNRLTAHKAWKDHVTELETKLQAKDAELARLRSVGGGGSGAVAAAPSGGAGVGVANGWHRVEALHEEHGAYRERMGARLQALRGEKEGLQRELHAKEDECHALEAKVQSLTRRLGVM